MFSSPALAVAAPKESAAPIARSERIAVRLLLPDIFDIASPSCPLRAVPINLLKSRQVNAVQRGPTGRGQFPFSTVTVSLGARPGVRIGADLSNTNYR